MELFDIVKGIFKSNELWNKVSNSDKSRNFFMINRIMAIRFPVQADQFNRLKISPSPVVDWWHRTLSKNHSNVPSWIYTKTNKSKKETKTNKSDDLEDFSEVEKIIREKYSVTSRQLSELKTFFPDKYNSWVSLISDQLRTSAK